MNELENIMVKIQTLIENRNQQIIDTLGMKFYKSVSGFTPEQIYSFAGANDYVSTLTLKEGSESAVKYGRELTVLFEYTIKERTSLEKDNAAYDNGWKVRAKELLNQISKESQELLIEEGLYTKDIVEMLVAPFTKPNNTFASKELRQPKVLEIPFEAEGNGKDIYWMYGAFVHYINDGIALSPEEYDQYLAYKMILEPEKLSEDERSEIFNENGAVKNPNIAFYVLECEKESGHIKDKDTKLLVSLRQKRFVERMTQFEKELNNMGLSFSKLCKRYPEKATLLLNKVLTFHEIRYNITGKHLMYLSYHSFLHIYLRHVKELTVENQFSKRGKFQLEEKDVLTTMDIVLQDLNDEYQSFKEQHPEKQFIRIGAMAYYYNGDYYDVRIRPDGQIGTFYKRTEKE